MNSIFPVPHFLRSSACGPLNKTFITLVNKPFAFTVPENAQTVICSFSKAPQSLQAAVDFLFGELKPTGVMPIDI